MVTEFGLIALVLKYGDSRLMDKKLGFEKEKLVSISVKKEISGNQDGWISKTYAFACSCLLLYDEQR